MRSHSSECPGENSSRSTSTLFFPSYLVPRLTCVLDCCCSWTYTLNCPCIGTSSSLLVPTSVPSTPPAAMSASGSGVPSASSGSSSVMKKAFPHVDLQGNDLPPSPAPSSPHAGRRYNIATELVFTEGNDQYNASSVPIYQV